MTKCFIILTFVLLGLTACLCDNDFSTSQEGDRWNSFFTLFTGGIPFMLWDNIRQKVTSNVIPHDLSPTCWNSLATAFHGMEDGQDWPFKFVDASSKTPSGLIDGTLTGLGDYDQCLDIVSPVGYGKYCLLEIFFKNISAPRKNSNDEQKLDEYLLEMLPLVKFFNPRIAICLPSKCSANEILQVVDNSLTGQPFGITSKVSCQTKHDIQTRMSRLLWPQRMSLWFLGVLLVTMLTSTVIDAFGLKFLTKNAIVESFSGVKNAQKLFLVDPRRNSKVDAFKFTFSMIFVSMHAITGSDNPASPIMISRLKVAMADANKLSFQIFFSDTLVEIMFLMTGYVTLQAIFPVLSNCVKSSRSVPRTLITLIFDKWLKLVPLITGLIALEFVWPLLGSGPLYEEGSEFVLTNCQKHWWNNMLLVSNWFPSIEKCTPQLFYTAVDFQLFAILLMATFFLVAKPRFGITFITLVIVSSMSLTGYFASKYQVTANFVAKNADLDDRMRFMDVIHQPTYSHATAYFIGVLIGFKAVTKTSIQIGPSMAKLLTIICYALSLAAIFAPALHNTWDLLPRSLVPWYIVLQKFFYVFAMFPILMPLPKSKKQVDENNNLIPSSESTDAQYSFMSCLYNLTFSIYLVNYYCIRFDFLTSRILFEPGLYHAEKRFIFSIFVTFWAALAFHLLVAAPFHGLKKRIFPSPTSFTTKVVSPTAKKVL